MKLRNLMRMVEVAITLVVATMSLSNVQGDEVDPRAPLLWRAISGHVLKAEFLDLKAGVVILKSEDGEVRNVPLNLLMPEDQAVAKTLAKRMTSGGLFAFKSGAKGELPVFTEGPGKGAFAFYTNANFMVSVSEKASITITCLENGKPVGKPILAKWNCSYVVKKKGGSPNRSIVSFDEDYAPVLQPDILTLSGLLQDKVRFGFDLAIKKNTIQIGGWIEDPPGLQSPTLFTPIFTFRSSHSFGAQVMVVDQKAAVKDLSLTLTPMKGKSLDLPYGDIPKDYAVPLLSAEIKGPVFGSRRVSLAVNRSQAAEMRFESNGGPVFGGFKMSLLKKDNASRDDTIRMSLTID